VAEVEIDNQDSGGGHDLGDADLAAYGKANDVAPTGGQNEEMNDCPPVGNEPKKRKPRAKKNVLSFKLPTGGQKKTIGGKQKTSPKLPTGGQTDETEWLKSILPTAQIGCWWETPADDKGFKIKLRWRVKGEKDSYVFRRLGKHEAETLKEKTYERQCWLIADRIFGELQTERRPDVAARIRLDARHDRVASAEN